MLRYLHADALLRHPRLARSMFRDRARQFRDRLGWAVRVDEAGEERDAYDALNPLYIIWENAGGRHGGSMRFLPTTGRTMVNDHFLHLTDGVRIAHAGIWECSRFCLSDGAAPQVSSALILGALEFGLAFRLSHAVGVFDARMLRIYRRLGWPPTVLGTAGHGREAVSVGLWDFDAALKPGLLARAEIAAAQSEAWLRDCLGPSLPALSDRPPIRLISSG